MVKNHLGRQVTNDTHDNERCSDSFLDRFLHHLLCPCNSPTVFRPINRSGSCVFHCKLQRAPSVKITSCAAAQKQSICSDESLRSFLPMLTWASPPPLHGVTKQRSEELVKQSGSSNPIALRKGRKEGRKTNKTSLKVPNEP